MPRAGDRDERAGEMQQVDTHFITLHSIPLLKSTLETVLNLRNTHLLLEEQDSILILLTGLLRKAH